MESKLHLSWTRSAIRYHIYHFKIPKSNKPGPVVELVAWNEVVVSSPGTTVRIVDMGLVVVVS